jgi:hypothetical protein
MTPVDAHAWLGSALLVILATGCDGGFANMGTTSTAQTPQTTRSTLWGFGVAPQANSATNDRAPDGQALCEQGSILECTAACDAGNALSCDTLAHYYGAGERVGKDDEASVRLYKRACLLGASSTCAYLTHTAPACGGGAYREYAVCGDVFHTACALGAVDDCGGLADLYEIVPKNIKSVPVAERQFALERLRGICASEVSAPAYGDSACVTLANGQGTPIPIRRFALDRICHSQSPGDTCGRLKDLALSAPATQ